jgi:hypothetical protein
VSGYGQPVDRASNPPASELVTGFEPETDLERAVAEAPELREGLAWGEPRDGHPEGPVGTHVADLLRAIDQRDETAERRRVLRFIALVHDSFKYRVHDWLPKTGSNHHAARARAFAERFTDDEAVLSVIELHDRPYSLWRKMQRHGGLDEGGFERMLGRIDDPELFLDFVELDGSTEGKRPEPTRWFREELERRGLVSPR